MEAAQAGDINALYAAIREDPYILERMDKIPFADTPLHVAAFNGNTKFAMEIVSLKPSFARKLNCNGSSPLHLALQNGKIQTVLCLLDIDPELVRVRGKEGVTPLHYVVEKGNLHLLARLLSVCPKSVEDVTIQSETALHVALKNNNIEAFKLLFRAVQCLLPPEEAQYSIKRVLNWKDMDGNTLLHLATYANRPEVVKCLIHSKVDVNVQNMGGLTARDIILGHSQTSNGEIKNILCGAGALGADSLPSIDTPVYFIRADQRLDEVAKRGDIEALYVLLRENAYTLEQIDVVPFVDTPLHVAAAAGHVQFALEMMRLRPSFARKQNQDGYSPLHLALQCGNTLLVHRLADADRNLVRVQGRKGETSLHFVAERGIVDLLVKFLTDCPESILDVTIRKETALHLAAKNDQLEALKVILEWLECIEKEEIVKWIDDEGNTLLHIAVSRGHIQMVRLLIKRKVPINERNSEGLTVLDIYERQLQVEELRDILCKAGAKKGSSHTHLSISNVLRGKVSLSPRITLYKYRNRRLVKDEERNAILVVAVLIATATYQAALTPTAIKTKATTGDGQSWPLDSSASSIFYFTNIWAFIAAMALLCCLLPKVYNWILVYPLVMSFTVLSYRGKDSVIEVLASVCCFLVLLWILTRILRRPSRGRFLREVLRPIFKHYRSFRNEMVAKGLLDEIQR